MIPDPIAPLLLLTIVAVCILLMLLRPKGIAEAYWVCGGALLLLALGLVSLSQAGRAAAKGTDVYLFLIGMMLVSELAREHGVFAWLAEQTVRLARGSRVRLFTLVYLAGTAVTVFLSNDATAVVLTPAILAATRRAKVPPLPFLFVCAFIANAASFVLPISNPANLVVFRGDMPSLARWMQAFALPSALSILATYAVLRWVFRAGLRGTINTSGSTVPLGKTGKLVLAGLAALVLALLLCSALDRDLGLPTCLVALAVTAVVSCLTRQNPWPLARQISWSTLALVAGLFVFVDAIESIGALSVTKSWLASALQLAPAAAALTTGFAVAIANNLVNNLPLGLLAGATLHASQPSSPIAAAVLIGVDLGPNLSITGSLATLLWLLALRKENQQVGFWSFFRIGAIAMPVALLLALAATLLPLPF